MIHLLTRLDLIKAISPPGSIGVEIGTWRGYFASDILNGVPNLAKLFCVDSWRGQTGIYTPEPKTDDEHEADMFEAFWHVRGHSGRVEIIRASSLATATHAKHIPSLDFCYIDADHSYEGCLSDLRAWAPRIKNGGYLAGHDYSETGNAKDWNFGVVKAVETFCREAGWRITHLTTEDFASFALQRQ